MPLWSAPSRNNGSKNSHVAVDTTNATVMGLDIAQCILHLWPNHFITPASMKDKETHDFPRGSNTCDIVEYQLLH